jgi:hypothetical protein
MDWPGGSFFESSVRLLLVRRFRRFLPRLLAATNSQPNLHSRNPTFRRRGGLTAVLSALPPGYFAVRQDFDRHEYRLARHRYRHEHSSQIVILSEALRAAQCASEWKDPYTLAFTQSPSGIFPVMVETICLYLRMTPTVGHPPNPT